MAKEPPFIWFEVGWKYHPHGTPQKIRNNYFYTMMLEINSHFVKWHKTFEWKQEMINKLINEIGEPKKLNIFQKLFT